MLGLSRVTPTRPRHPHPGLVQTPPCPGGWWLRWDPSPWVLGARAEDCCWEGVRPSSVPTVGTAGTPTATSPTCGDPPPVGPVPLQPVCGSSSRGTPI